MQHAHRTTVLVVENDAMQRALVSMLLEEHDMTVIQCDSAEAAIQVLENAGHHVSLVFTDVTLAGSIDGIQLAYITKLKFPDVHVVVTSDTAHVEYLPHGTTFMAKPWSPNHLIREADSSLH